MVATENTPDTHHLVVCTLCSCYPWWSSGCRRSGIDTARHARGSLPTGEYLTSSYYEIWTRGLEALLADAGLVTAEELARGRVLEPAMS